MKRKLRKSENPLKTRGEAGKRKPMKRIGISMQE